MLSPAQDGVLDSTTCALRWRPVAWQVGYNTIRVRATDRFGASVEHAFRVLVRQGNRPPLIRSALVPEAEVNQPFVQAIQVEDPDGDAVSLSWTGNIPPGLSLTNGVIIGTPTTAGTYDVVLRAEDARGAISELPARLVVLAVLNWPPVITSDPVLSTVTGASYSYQVQATDRDGDSLSYSVVTSPSVSMSVSGTGLVSWAVPSNYVAAGQTASVVVTLRATDNGTPSRYSEQNYTLVVSGNRAPTLASVLNPAVYERNPLRVDLKGEDPDGDPLTYTLTGRNGTVVPPDMTVDGLGRLRWLDTKFGLYDLTATVTDTYGLSASQDFQVKVSHDYEAPGLALQVQSDPGKVGEVSRFKVDASDNVAVTERTLEFSDDGGMTWTGITLDADGVGRWTFATAGYVQLRATARDAANNVTTVTRDLTVIDPSALGAPEVTLTTPVSNARVTTLTQVTGSITDADGLLSWKLEYAPDNGDTWHLLKQVTNGLGTSVAVDETFDPTLLPNGMYALRLSATDTGGNPGTVTRTILVDGRLKQGNLTFSATDLTIPVAGIPITVGRVYDTLDADKSGDFGHGWKLSLGGYSATVDQRTTAPAFLNSHPTFKDGTRVYVTRPDGGIDGYTFTPVPASGFLGIVTSWYPAFTPDAGVLNDLRVDLVPLTKIESTGEYVDYELGGYNPIAFGGSFDIVEYGGLTHEIDARDGHQISVRDRNDNKLTFEDDAIVSNRGVQVTFLRDGQGRIIAAEDPRGNKVRYRYDGYGDLVEVTDRAGVVIASYGYRSTEPLHYLTGVTDANGTRSLEASYYQGGDPLMRNRLMEVKDAEGQAATMSYTLTGGERSQSVTVANPAGGTTTSQAKMDEWGNPTEVKQAVGSVEPSWSTMTYSTDLQKQRGTPSQTRQVKGQIDTPQNQEDDDVVTTLEYDERSNVTSATDALGGVTRMSYGEQGEVLTASDALGNTTRNTNDAKGNLTGTRSQEGIASGYEYDPRGLMTKMKQAQAISQMGYDSVGRLTSQTNPAGVTTTFAYDANGNQTGSTSVWVDPNNPANQRTLTTGVTYDPNDQATQSLDAQPGEQDRIRPTGPGREVDRQPGQREHHGVRHARTGHRVAFVGRPGDADELRRPGAVGVDDGQHGAGHPHPGNQDHLRPARASGPHRALRRCRPRCGDQQWPHALRLCQCRHHADIGERERLRPAGSGDGVERDGEPDEQAGLRPTGPGDTQRDLRRHDPVDLERDDLRRRRSLGEEHGRAGPGDALGVRRRRPSHGDALRRRDDDACGVRQPGPQGG